MQASSNSNDPCGEGAKWLVKCPYCRMDVDIEATVCGHCQRDLVLYSPISQRCARTERGLTALHDSLGEVDFGPSSAIVGSIVLAFLLDYASWLPFASGWIAVPFESLAVLAPFFAAIVLGRFSGRISPIACSAVGIIAGLGGFAAHVIVWSFGALHSSYSDCISALNHMLTSSCKATVLLPSHWYVSAISYPAAGALLFISGHAFGRTLAPSPFQKWIADKSLGGAEKNQTLRRSVEVVIGVLTAVLPRLIEFLLGANHGTNGVSGAALH